MTSKNDSKSNLKCKNFYVLGDSLSDNGVIVNFFNNLAFLKSPFSGHVKFKEPFYQGRSFTNGPTAVEYIAKYLGVKEFKPGWSYSFFLKHHEQQGQNYSVSNASASELPSRNYELLYNRFCLANQLNALIKHHPDTGEEDLVLIMIGGNDIMYASTLKKKDESEIILCKAVEGICDTLETLYKSHIRHAVVVNTPNIGLIPAFNKNEEEKKLLTDLSKSFNVKLADKLAGLQVKYRDFEIKQFNLFSSMQGMIDEYKKKGYNYQDACITDIVDQQSWSTLLDLLRGKLDSDYNQGCDKNSLNDHIFFDYFHPTAALHEKVANELALIFMNSRVKK